MKEQTPCVISNVSTGHVHSLQLVGEMVTQVMETFSIWVNAHCSQNIIGGKVAIYCKS